jgi:hypothetical protein
VSTFDEDDVRDVQGRGAEHHALHGGRARLPCDHIATKASLTAFLAVTTFVGFQVFPDGEVQLLANCKACNSTLAVAIEMPRGPHGNEAAGEIGAIPAAPHESPVFEGETMEQHAERIIT